LEYDPKGAGYTFPIATQARLDKENKIQPWRNSLAVSLNQNAELPHETIIPNANDCNPSWASKGQWQETAHLDSAGAALQPATATAGMPVFKG
jgi:hypothetical protein